MKNLNDKTILIFGLGYVGLPLSIEFAKKFKTIGYDHSITKINNYCNKIDPMGEISYEEFRKAKKIEFSSDPKVISKADVIIIAVPTPVDEAQIPDLIHLRKASETVALNMKRNTIIVFESTVFPGATEEICIPIIEKNSEMEWKKDFNVGYSPERVNPGDKNHTITKIVKVVSGDTISTLNILSDLYSRVIKAGVFKAKSIKIAEAAKVIENTQRDLNISLMNELAIIFERMNIDTKEVLNAASTKWNFLNFYPGLVGGHCIGVDPYYLTYKSKMLGYDPLVILAGRKINDYMGKFVADKTVKLMIKNGVDIGKSRVVILGITFKEDCNDFRNSKIPDMALELKSYGIDVLINDPYANKEEVFKNYNIGLIAWDEIPSVDAVVLAVPHKFYLSKTLEDLKQLLKKKGVIVDIKSSLKKFKNLETKNIKYWRL